MELLKSLPENRRDDTNPCKPMKCTTWVIPNSCDWCESWCESRCACQRSKLITLHEFLVVQLGRIGVAAIP